MNPLLFAFVAVAWGMTWYGIKLQLGPTPAEVSIFWRFALSAAMMWVGLIATGRSRPAPLRAHPWFAALGLTLFSVNFLCFYNAERFVASGVVSVVFSMATVFNVINLRLFHGVRPSLRVVAGALLGAFGVAGLFLKELASTATANGAPLGLLLTLGGAYCFSLGNLISRRATRDGVDLPNAIARGMTWGSLFLAAMVVARGQSFAPDLSPTYLAALVFLALVASVLGFLAYLSLVARIGPERAAYVTVLSPLIALALSSVLEGYVWSRFAFVAVPAILLGNVMIFRLRLPWRIAVRR